MILDTTLLENCNKAILEREKTLLLGIPPILTSFLKIPEQSDPYIKAALGYFLPLSQWIKQDLRLGAYCIQTILQLPEENVRIKNMASVLVESEQPNIDKWKVSIDTIAAGKKEVEDTCIEISFLLPLNSSPADYLIGGAKRSLLETTLYPSFIADDYRCITKIDLESDSKLFQIESDQVLGSRVGINTLVH